MLLLLSLLTFSPLSRFVREEDCRTRVVHIPSVECAVFLIFVKLVKTEKAAAEWNRWLALNHKQQKLTVVGMFLSIDIRVFREPGITRTCMS